MLRKLVSTRALAAVYLLLIAACGVDNRTPAAGPETSPTPVEASATPTVPPDETAEPTSAMLPESTVFPTSTPSPTVTPSCVTPAELSHERVKDWPDSADIMSAVVNAVPWDLQGLPDDVPMDPELDLLDGMDAPFDITGDGPVTLSLTAYNRYDETIAFEMSGDPGYDFAVFSMSGEVVWMYSDDVDAESGQNFLELEPDESRELTATWDLTGPGGERVEDGLYFVAGIMFREEPHVEMREQFMYIGERPSLEDSLDVRLSAPSETSCGEAVPMTLEVTNVTGDLVRISGRWDMDNYFVFRSGVTGEGKEVWSLWPREGGVTPDYAEGGWMRPGESVAFVLNWGLQDLSGDHVPPGAYELQASFRVTLIDDGEYNNDDVEQTLWSNIVEVTVIE